MNNSLDSFLLFESSVIERWGQMVLNYITAFGPLIFVISLAWEISKSEMPEPSGVLKRFLVAQFIILFVPSLYKPIAGFGMTVGKSIVSQTRTGIIGKWNTIEKKIERQLHKEGNPKERPSAVAVVSGLMQLNLMNITEQFLGMLVLAMIFIQKIVFSFLFYGGFFTFPILLYLAIFGPFKALSISAVKSIVVTVLTPIIIAIFLLFMNEVIGLQVNSEGFLTGALNIIKLFGLSILLLSSVPIATKLVNGVGIEGKASNLSQMAQGAMIFRATQLMSNSAQRSKDFGVRAATMGIGAASSVMTPLAGAAAHMATRPIVTAASGLKSGISQSLSNKSNSIQANKLTPSMGGLDKGSQSLIFGPGTGSNLTGNESTPLISGRYESELQKLTNEKPMAAINPVNHLKASAAATKSLASDSSALVKHKLGLPQDTSNLTMKEKSILMTNNLINGNAQKIKSDELLKSQIIANKISKSLEGKNNG